MINVSDAFKQKLQDGEKVWQEVEITFPDGTVKTVKDEIMGENCTFSDCAESSSFPIGCVVCKSMTLELDNSQDQWKDYYFYQAKVHSYLKMQIDASTVETIDKGVYTITTPEQYGELLSFASLDDMYKANSAYMSSLVLPQSVETLVRDACETLGIPFGGTMQHGNLIISEIPENMTFRQLFGWAAMLETANARLDNRGYLQFIRWDFSNVQEDCGAIVDTDGSIAFKGGANIDSENFISPVGNWTIDNDGFLTLIESATDASEKLKDFFTSPTVSSDDIVITGIKLKNRENEAMYGSTGYVLELENDLVADSSLDTVAAQIGDSIIGVKFRNMSGELAYNPLIEFGDMAYTYDRKWNRYITPLTDVSCSVNGKTAVKTQADDPIRNSSTYMSAATKALVEARRLVKDERTEREKAVERLNNTLKTSGGLYMTVEPQDDGSNIYYAHNKPTLEESDIVWKFTAEAIGISMDGGKTYPYGLNINGELIARLLYAEGINASYINTGALVVRDANGKIIFSADIDNNQIVIDGASVRIGASPLDGLLNSMQGQIDGNINTWTGTSVPTLNNYPANEWLEDAEMSKHVGDIYYDGDSHAYRFVNEGSGYYWKRLKDTDVTKALQDSEDALSAAKQAQEAAALAKNMTLQLSNEYHGISVDSDGNYDTFPSDVITQAVVMYGTQDITSDCNFTIIKSDGVTGSWNNSTKTYTVTALSTDDGWVDIKATYISVLSVTKRFSISKIYAGGKGEKGEQGIPGRTFFIQLSANVLKRGQNNAVTPATLTANAFYRDGNSAARYPYEGRWKIETSTDGVNYTEASVSIENESIKSYLVGSLQKDIVSVRFTLYEAGGTEHPLDMQSVPIAIDVDNLTHEEIFNLLTKNGLLKGIYKEGGELYINASFLKSGIIEGIALKAVTGDITGEFTSTSTNSWGKEYVKIKDAIIAAGLDGTQKSLIDMVAQYADGLHLVIKNDTEINIEAPVLKILTDILNIGDGKISITQKSLAEAQVNVANTDISGRLVASGGRNFGLYNVTTGSWVIKSDKTGVTVLPATTIDGETIINNDLEVSGSAILGSVDVKRNEYIAGALEVVGEITNHEKISVTKSDLSEAQIDISNSDISGRLTASSAKNFGLYHITFSKWLIRMGSDGNAYLPDTIFKGTATFNKDTIFNDTASFSKTAIFNETANFKKPPKLYNLTHVTSGNHLVMASDGASIAYLGSSSLRYKDVRGTVKENDLESLYQIKVVWAKYKNEYLDASDERYGKEMPMFLAEDIDQHFPLAVDHDEQGRAENWNYRVMIPCMFAMLKNDHEKISSLQSELENMKSELQELKKLLKGE